MSSDETERTVADPQQADVDVFAQPQPVEQPQPASDPRLDAALAGLDRLSGLVGSLASRLDDLAARPVPQAAPAAVAAPEPAAEPVEHPPLKEGSPLDRLHAIESRLLAWEPVLAEVVSAAGSFMPGGLGVMLRHLGAQLGHLS